MPGALTTVAYKRAIMSGYRPVKRMRMTAPGYSRYGYMARVGYQGAKWAVPRIQRWYRKRRNKKLRHKMYRRTDRESAQRGKAHQNGIPGGANQEFPLGALQISRNMPYPPQATTVDQVNLRKNQTVYMKGFKVCRTFYVKKGNDPITGSTGVEVHWALLQMKMSARTDADIAVNFFRDNSSSTSRTRDFSAYGPTDPWSAEFNCLPLNPGNDFNIITHQKKVIYPMEGTGANKRNYWKLERYYPLKKHVKFIGTNGQPENNVIEVYWANTISSEGFPANPTTDAVATWFTHTGYFSDKM